LGTENAVQNTSVARVAPRAMMAMSRSNPSTRDRAVIPATIFAAPKKCSRSP